MYCLLKQIHKDEVKKMSENVGKTENVECAMIQIKRLNKVKANKSAVAGCNFRDCIAYLVILFRTFSRPFRRFRLSARLPSIFFYSIRSFVRRGQRSVAAAKTNFQYQRAA